MPPLRLYIYTSSSMPGALSSYSVLIYSAKGVARSVAELELEPELEPELQGAASFGQAGARS
jgi:hypothetical protein